MSAIRWILPLSASLLLGGSSLLLGGCGLYPPEIQEFPNDWATGQKFVFDIVHNITCEVRDSINYVYDQDQPVDPRFKNLTFMKDWGVQVELALTIDEKGSLGPSVNWMPHSPASAIFNITGSATLSSDATRIDKLYAFYTVADIRKHRYCDARPTGPFLLENDLKLKEWLFEAVMLEGNREVNFSTDPNGPFKSTVLSHEIKFDILSSGNVTPTWKFKLVTVDPSGNLLGLSRERTHDLIITLGPTTPAPGGKTQPSLTAANAALASDINAGVTNGVRAALQP